MEEIFPPTEFQIQNSLEGNRNEIPNRKDSDANQTNSLRIPQTRRGHVLYRPMHQVTMFI